MTRHMIGIAVLLTFTLAAPAMADDHARLSDNLAATA